MPQETLYGTKEGKGIYSRSLFTFVLKKANLNKNTTMTRTYLLLLTMLLSSQAFAQNWAPFPLHQKSYYDYGVAPDHLYAGMTIMDSVSTSGPSTTLFFGRNLDLPGASPCYLDIVDAVSWLVNPYDLDTMVHRNDTIYYYSTGSATPFYFLPMAQVGQSWTVTSTYPMNDYSDITITCASIGVETFFGITDSVKTFTMAANGVTPGQVPVDNFEMKLSKLHGFVEFVPFILFLEHSGSTDFATGVLMGLDSAGIAQGFEQPTFHDYFHLSAGDVLLWKRQVDSDWTTEPSFVQYYRDSITQVYSTPDSVIYTMQTIKQDSNNVISQPYNTTATYLKSDLGNVVETPPRFAGAGAHLFGNSGWPSSVLLWESGDLEAVIDVGTGDTTYSYEFSSEANFLDTSDCSINQTIDAGFYFSIDSRAGVTQHCRFSFGSDCWQLIGSEIDGELIGTIALSLEELRGNTSMALTLYPNPATDAIFIDNLPAGAKIAYQILNSTGQFCKEGMPSGNEITTAELPGGMYFVRATIDGQVVWGKFVKR